MNKYFDSAILMTSICSMSLTTLSIAEDKIPHQQAETIKQLQLERLDHFLAVNLDHLQTPDLSEKPIKLVAQAISDVGINLIKEFEGFEAQTYIDTDGTPVIGYGLSKIAGQPVQVGDRISPEQAHLELNAQLHQIKQKLNQAVKVNLTESQWSALASLSFNVGIEPIENSTLIVKLNSGDYQGAANEFLRWDKANIRGRLVQMPGLIRRRQAEKQLFSS